MQAVRGIAKGLGVEIAPEAFAVGAGVAEAYKHKDEILGALHHNKKPIPRPRLQKVLKHKTVKDNARIAKKIKDHEERISKLASVRHLGRTPPSTKRKREQVVKKAVEHARKKIRKEEQAYVDVAMGTSHSEHMHVPKAPTVDANKLLKKSIKDLNKFKRICDEECELIFKIF